MQIRSQYLIQDNHNDYTSEPPFSRVRICLLSCTHVCIPSPDTYSPPFLRDARLSFSPSLLLRLPSRVSLCKIVYGWKLEVPRCPAAVRGVSWQKCNAAYHKICPRWSLRKRGEREGNDLHVIHECTVWFGSTRQEIDDGSDEKIPAGGNFERTLVKMVQGIRSNPENILLYFIILL